ncbi:MAG: acetylornithine deacetylase [Myxococcaceae bacterium]|nr:acetylornithine deacetylase [Myxococcaceae bacterium]
MTTPSPLREALTRTLRELVAIDSTSSRSNGPIIELLEAKLRALGFSVALHPYEDDAGVRKVNLLATRGEGRPQLALVGHSDCVPFDPAWTEALVLTERDGKLFGRGAADTKGFIACALVALEQVGLDALKKPLLVVFTADEEVGCIGAKRLVDAGVGRARYAIVGEPTQLRPIRANKGYCLAEVEVRGKEGHSAYPEVGVSAIFHAARFLKKLEEAAQTVLRAETDELFQPPYTTVNVGMIEGGKAKNIIPGRCRFIVEWRPIPSQPTSRVTELLKSIVADLQREDPAVDVQIRVTREDRGVDTAATSEVVQFLVRESGNAPGSVPFGTEAPQLTALGAEAVVFGPGDIRVAHRTGEFVPIEDLERCEAILERALRHFCG